MSFGRKGLQPGQAAPQPAGGFGRAGQASAASTPAAPSVDDEMAAKREAFIASERARKMEEIGGGSLPDANGEYASDPMAHLRNDARPAKPMAAMQTDHSANASYSAPAPRAARRDKKWLFGAPHQRNLFLAYVLWYFACLFSVHRFYCGNSDSAWYQMGLFFGGIVVALIYAPLGIALVGGWFLWIFADLFLMPGMMRRFKAQYAQVDTGIFE